MSENYDLKRVRMPRAKTKKNHMAEMTNSEFVEYLMTFSPKGMMSQIFIMTALDVYSQHSLQHDTTPNKMVNAEAWRDTAEFIHRQFKRRYAKEEG